MNIHRAEGRRPFGIDNVCVGGQKFTIETSDIFDAGYGVLLGFKRVSTDTRRVLVVAPLAGGFSLLLRDLVLELLRHAGEVFVTDWPDARYVPLSSGRFGFVENIEQTHAMMRFLGAPLHVVGVCEGAISAMAAAALMAEDEPGTAPLSLALIGAPINPLINPSRSEKFAAAHELAWFEANAIETVPVGFPGEGRRVYPKTLQLANLNRYVARHLVQREEIFWKFLFDDGEDVINFPFAKIIFSLMDLPGEFFLENVARVFKGGGLMRPLDLNGRVLAPQSLSAVGLLTIEGARDDIVPPGQTKAAHGLCRVGSTALRRHATIPIAGHFALFHGGTMRDHVSPLLIDFFDTIEEARQVY